MHFSTWLAFVSVSLVACFSPGPGVLLAISNAMSQGPRRALVSSSGNALGICIVAAVATIGLGAVLKTSATLFLGLKIAGAGYLIYLGIRQWSSGGARLAAAAEGGEVLPEKSPRQLFREGLWVAITNPKTILFFTALFPQFMHTEHTPFAQFLVLTATFVCCSLFSHVVFVVLARRARTWFESERGVRRLNRGAGAMFVLLGLGLLSLRRAQGQ
ncbi:MAG TPA: LysE family translocator [Burkholderiaceae bacterium]|jgi:threonine/homoserine/homoserine lactone efflux protein